MSAAARARRASDSGLARAVAVSATTSATLTSARVPAARLMPSILRPSLPCASLCLLHTILPLMEKTTTHVPGAHEHEHPHEHHEELGFWRKYVFSVDHKVIGIQYAVTGLLFLLFGFCLMMLMRWQLAYPEHPIPLIGGLLGDSRAPGGVMLPEFYNQLGAMHGTIMVFLGVVPLAVGGFGTF